VHGGGRKPQTTGKALDLERERFRRFPRRPELERYRASDDLSPRHLDL